MRFLDNIFKKLLDVVNVFLIFITDCVFLQKKCFKTASFEGFFSVKILTFHDVFNYLFSSINYKYLQLHCEIIIYSE